MREPRQRLAAAIASAASPPLRGTTAIALVAVVALLSLASCSDPRSAREAHEAAGERADAGTDTAATVLPAFAQLRAALVLEPLQLMIGEVITAQITVVTPPDHRLLPVKPPEVAGVWLLDATMLEVDKSEMRWVHQSQLRLRTRAVGPLVWPAFQVVVEDARGAQHSIDVSGREFEVVSMLKDFPDQLTPFGLRTWQPPRGNGGFWLGAGIGAAATLALAAAALAFYRVRDRVPEENEATRRNARAREATLWEWAEGELTAAEAALDSPEGPRHAANRGARLLRQYVERRFSIQTEALTTEELGATKPPLAIDSRWPELVRILTRFDAERFRASELEGSTLAGVHSDPGSASHRSIRKEIEAVKRFVADSTPHELRR